MDIQEKHHFVLLPFMAQGHMIPMVDISRLLSKRGIAVTILATPPTHARFKTVLERAAASGLAIRVSHIKLPSSEAGLPEGCDNFDMLSSPDDIPKFFRATAMLEEQVEQTLRNIDPPPTCLLSDMCYPWTTAVAARCRIPRLVFHGMSCFSLLCMRTLFGNSEVLEDVASDTEYFEMPGLTDRIEITKVQLRGKAGKVVPESLEVRKQILKADFEAFGTVCNTFEELEPEYLKGYAKLKGTEVWCIGPVSLCNEDALDKAHRGNKPSIHENDCLIWLDSREAGSVIYVCLGSLARLAVPQLVELGLGLEASGRPFVWVIRNASHELGTWLVEEKFEQRVMGRGLLIQGWAPQVLILSHPSVGGFLTHCGWNSTLEGVTVGVPMLAWPIFAEQFLNEKFIVSVAKTGVRVGVELPVAIGDEEMVGVQVKREGIKVAIEELMGSGGEGEERRERARELGKMAKTAWEEGGSSSLNMTRLIEAVTNQKNSWLG